MERMNDNPFAQYGYLGTFGIVNGGGATHGVR